MRKNNVKKYEILWSSLDIRVSHKLVQQRTKSFKRLSTIYEWCVKIEFTICNWCNHSKIYNQNSILHAQYVSNVRIQWDNRIINKRSTSHFPFRSNDSYTTACSQSESNEQITFNSWRKKFKERCQILSNLSVKKIVIADV